MSTTESAKKILVSGDLEKEGYSLKQLFEIRDALKILERYGLEDKELLAETELYIIQKADTRLR